MSALPRIFALLALVVALAACGSREAEPAARAAPAIETFVVAAPSSSGMRDWDGVVEAVQQADLVAQTGGRVTAVEVDVNDAVRAGQVLLRLSAVEQQAGAAAARAQVQEAQAAAVEADARYARVAALAQRQFVSAQQHDEARAARDAARARRDAARAQLAQAGQQADYTTVRAPFAGVVSARRVESGEAVAPGQALLSVYAPGALRVAAEVPASDARAIRAAPRATLELQDGRLVEATDVFVFPAADPNTHSVTVRAVLPPEAASGLVPGMTVKVLLPGGETSASLKIPRSAVSQRGELSGVYVLAGDRIVLRQVRLGDATGAQVDVLAGLSAGERVAADPVAAVAALVAQRRVRDGADD